MTIIEMFSKGLKNPKKALDVVNYKLLNAIGYNHFRPFIVLTRSRTGSNLLISLLDSHPNIKAEGERLRRLNGENCKTVLSKVFSKQPYDIKAKGFKIFYYHPMDNNPCDIWKELKSMNGLYVIHLKRENILRTLISRKIAGIQDVWLIRSDQDSNAHREDVTVSFTVGELHEEFQKTKNWEEDGENNFRNHPLLSVSYEDLVSERLSTFRKVTKFLGVPFAEPKSELKKQNTNSMRALIENYDELKSAFAKTKWAHFFED